MERMETGFSTKSCVKTRTNTHREIPVEYEKKIPHHESSQTRTQVLEGLQYLHLQHWTKHSPDQPNSKVSSAVNKRLG